jgi:Molybdopterin oxidoreductase Fe4S4 domain
MAAVSETAPAMVEWQPTACVLCACNCGIEVQVADGTITRVKGDKAHPGSPPCPTASASPTDRAGRAPGVAPNELTDSARRDWLAGTPWHKHVPARVERAQPGAVA